MLDLSSRNAVLAARPEQGSDVVVLCHAGVRYDLLPADAAQMVLPDDYAPYLVRDSAGASPPTAVRVISSLRRCYSLPGTGGGLNEIQIVQRPAGMRLRHRYFRADLRRIAPDRYAAAVDIAPGELALAAFLRFSSVAVLQPLGGLSLHAAALALDGHAIALMGPSGAGKSTACNLSSDAECLAYDQLMVYPVAGRYYAWALPWGGASSLPRSSTPVLPLAACLRVTRGTPMPQAWSVDRSRAAFLVRSAASASDCDPDSEMMRLDAALQVVGATPVGYLSTVLGQRADLAIRSWLAGLDRAVA